MATTYTQNFSLLDIFNNPKLKNKLPLINYKEKEAEDGSVSIRTNVKTIIKQVYDTSKSAGKMYYKPLKASKTGNRIELGGKLIVSQDRALNGVYRALNGIKQILIFTANNTDVIRTALKESEKNKRKYGLNSKLFLRAQSMQQIEGMTKTQLYGLINDVMANIYYGDDFPETQKKYGVKNLQLSKNYNYEQLKRRWKNKVGDV